MTSQVLEVTGQNITTPHSPETLLYTTYKQRSDEFRKLFKEVPESEKLIAGMTDRGRQRGGETRSKIYSACLLTGPQCLCNHIRYYLNEASLS